MPGHAVNTNRYLYLYECVEWLTSSRKHTQHSQTKRTRHQPPPMDDGSSQTEPPAAPCLHRNSCLYRCVDDRPTDGRTDGPMMTESQTRTERCGRLRANAGRHTHHRRYNMRDDGISLRVLLHVALFFCSYPMRSFASRQVRTGDGAPAATAQIKYLHIAECPWVVGWYTM